MRKYENLLLFSPELGMDELTPIVENLKGVLERQGGTLIAIDDWGMKELAYPVRKFFRGHYVRLEFNAPAAAIAELERIIRITDGIMKFVTVKLDEHEEAAPVAAAASEEASE
ncbi:MAG: 30S ribosomal protein S6 [Desulfovibrio sp.]|nr:30S ribosomal protein S6 [Desulfovibrio sp.]MCA1985224.1 30S ribosomal protein S6 [Desulfovibrio sp.]